MKDLLTLQNLTTNQITDILELAHKLKADNKAGITHHILKGKPSA